MICKLKIALVFFSLLLLNVSAFAQTEKDRLERIERELNEASKKIPGLNSVVDFTANNYTIQEVIRAIASDNDLNVVVNPNLTDLVTYNFSNVTAKEVFLLFCKQHNVTIEFTGNILSFSKVTEAPPAPVYKTIKPINISYDKNNGLVEADLSGDTLYYVLKKLASLSDINIGLHPELHNKIIQKHIVSLPFEEALKELAGDDEWVKVSDKFYKVNPKKAITAEVPSAKGTKNSNKNNYGNQNNQNNSGNASEGDIEIEVLPTGKISVTATNALIADVIKQMSERIGVNYYLSKEPTEKTTIHIVERNYDEILKILFNGTSFTFTELNGIFLIGDRSQEGLRSTVVVQLQHRIAEDMKDFIPADLKKNLEVLVFVEQNSLILSGSEPQIKELEYLIKQLDKVVPVILIEVMIVDISKTNSTTSGIKAGFKSKDKPGTPDYTFNQGDKDGNPDGVKVTMDGGVLNSIINSFNGFGWLNLGMISSDFYLSIQAMESNNMVKVRSTPKLSTLNGHEANMSIGKSEFYLEQTTNLIGTQNPQTQITNVYKPVNADLTIKIKPTVSGDGQITMEIEVQQNDFTDTRVTNTGPPNSVKRKFESMVRVKDQNIIILGGLEESSTTSKGSGVPILSRIPILKWFFSSRSKSVEKTKLVIFIKPTVIY